jgi:cell division protein FtsB
MREFQGKKVLKNLLYSRIFVSVLLLVVVFLSYRIWGIGTRSRAINTEKESMFAQVAELAARKQTLERDLTSLKTDRGVEEAIREKFSVVKEGEGVVTVVAPTTTVPTTTAKSWWQAIWPF